MMIKKMKRKEGKEIKNIKKISVGYNPVFQSFFH